MLAQRRNVIDLRGIGALVLLTASFAMLTVFSRYLDSGFTIAQQVYLRTGIAFLIAIVAFGRWISWRVVLHIGLREWGVIVGRTALLYVFGTTLFAKAATMTTVSNISFIAALPLVSALGLLLRRVRVTAVRVFFVSGSAVGVAILSGLGIGFGGAAVSGNEGDLIALVAMVAISLSYLGRDWHSGQLNNYEITALTVGVGTVGVALTSAAQWEGLPQVPAHVSPGLLWGAIGVAGVLSVLNVFLMNYAFEHVNPVQGGNLLTLECVWGLLFGLLFFQQVPTWSGIAGGVLIVLCAVGLNLADRPGAESETGETDSGSTRRKPAYIKLTAVEPTVVLTPLRTEPEEAHPYRPALMQRGMPVQERAFRENSLDSL
ncbi:DMT family transporter [Nocardia altamirensis]|uniref:DMT family transporter n=1 Tax=Nocardia altamirensis TaxID=472158 RepID=UPI00083FF6E8|nr:DMT family transporter [Nocardia altamirensis]